MAEQPTWRALLDLDEAASIWQHPELLPSATQPPHLLSRLAPRPGHGGLETSCDDRWMAILRPHKIAWASKWFGSSTARLRGLQLVGDRLLGSQQSSAAQEFLDAVEELLEQRVADCLLIEALDISSALWSVIRQRSLRFARLLAKPSQPHWQIRLPHSADDYWRTFSGKTRYNLRRATTRLEHTTTCYRRCCDVAEFLEQAEYVSRRSWQHKRLGTRLRHCPEHVAYLERLARLGVLRCYLLRHEQEPLAFVFGLQWKGRFYYEECGHQTAWSRYSPGTILLVRLLEDLMTHDRPQVLDFGCGDSEQKRLFGNEQGASARILLFARRLHPTIARQVMWVRHTCSGQVRRLLNYTPFYRTIRQRYRQRSAS